MSRSQAELPGFLLAVDCLAPGCNGERSFAVAELARFLRPGLHGGIRAAPACAAPAPVAAVWARPDWSPGRSSNTRVRRGGWARGAGIAAQPSVERYVGKLRPDGAGDHPAP
jgi:hypothetical protein